MSEYPGGWHVQMQAGHFWKGCNVDMVDPVEAFNCAVTSLKILHQEAKAIPPTMNEDLCKFCPCTRFHYIHTVGYCRAMEKS